MGTGVLCCALAVPVGEVGAQTQRFFSPKTSSGQLERYLQVPAVPKATPEFLLPEAERQKAREQEAPLTLVLTDVVVEGATVYPETAWRPLYAQHLGQDISLDVVFELAEAITAKYRNDGYVLSRAVVPPQTITGGIVRLRVVEGYIHTVRIEGTVRGRRALLEAYAEKLEQARPLALAALERYVLLVNDLPGVTVAAVLGPAPATPGASELVLKLTDRAADGFLRVDNRGTRFNGPGQVWLGVGSNSLFGQYERLTGRVVVTHQPNELKYYEVGHEQQVGTEGGKLYLQFARTESEPGAALKELQVQSTSHLLRVGGTLPVLRSRARNVSLYAELVARNTETTILGERLSRDQQRFLRVGVWYDSVDRFGGVHQVGLHVHQGLSMLGASPNGSRELSREQGRTNFTKLRLTAGRLQQLSPRWSLLATLTSQYALSKLLASEEFGVGGERCVRAYDLSEATGDQGVCLLGELRYGQVLDTWALAGYQVYGFSDIGGVWREDPGVLARSAHLASAGAGVRLNFTATLSGSMEVAWPLITEVDQRVLDVAPVRGFFTMTARF